MSLPLEQYPYTDFHELNLDYIMKKVNTFADRLTEDETLLNTLPDYIKNVSLSNNTLVFTKGNNEKVNIILPTGAPFNLIIKMLENETPLNDPDLSIGNEVNFSTDYDYDAVTEIINNVLAGNTGHLIIKDLSDNVKYAGTVYYSLDHLYFDLMVRYYDNDTSAFVYVWRSFMVNYQYSQHTLTVKLLRVK